jgi:site-specific DNA-methyltransferase (adenine-specific)
LELLLKIKDKEGEQSYSNHPTHKPLKLMEYLIQLVTPKNGIVLDPFMGSGTTGIACKNKGFGFVGIEKEKEYFEIAKARIGNQQTL